MTKLMNKTTRNFIIGPIDFVNRVSDEFQRKWETAGADIAKYLE